MHPEPDSLQRVPLFATVTDEECDRVAAWFEIEEHDGGEVGRLGPGDLFGELALLGDGRRHADVVAVTDVRVLSMFGTHFREMQTSMPSVEAGLERLADDRLARPPASDQPA